MARRRGATAARSPLVDDWTARPSSTASPSSAATCRPLGSRHRQLRRRWPPTSWPPSIHAGGAARIIAPAGSGKTRVLTERARLLLRGWGVPAGGR